jgi:hypothetical protein
MMTARSLAISLCGIVLSAHVLHAQDPAGYLESHVGFLPAMDGPPRVTRAANTREVTLPAGTPLSIILETPVASDTSHVEDAVRARLSLAVMRRGITAVPQGSEVFGVVTDATRSARVKGRARIAVRFDTLVPLGDTERYRMRTAAVGRTAAGTEKKDAIEIGAPAAGGAIVGAILGGKKGAAIGTAVGGGAGAAVVLSTSGKEVRLLRGARLILRLTSPVTIRVKD